MKRNIYVYLTESLYCMSEINIINYTSIKIFFLKKWKITTPSVNDGVAHFGSSFPQNSF